MDQRRLARGIDWILGIALALLVLGTIGGCDRVDSKAVLTAGGAGASSSDEMAETQAAAPGRRRPDMQSIGPESAQRIYYQFVDDRGHVQFVERLSDVPAAWREQLGFVEMNQPPPLTPMEARRTWKLSSSRTAEIMLANAAGQGRADASQTQHVILYSATWCGYCTKARAHLDRAGVQYEIRDVDNEAVRRELLAKTGRGGVPVLDFSGEVLRGYSPDQYDRAIDTIRTVRG